VSFQEAKLGKTKFVVQCAGVVFLLVAGTQITVASDTDAAKQFGLIGSWAVDCEHPAGIGNPYQTFASSSDGSITLSMTDNIKGQDVLINIRDLKLVGTDMLSAAWSSAKSNGAMAVTLQKAGNKIHSWESLDATGKKLIDKGLFVAAGKSAPWATKCSPA
jgi:hypothetical protein